MFLGKAFPLRYNLINSNTNYSLRQLFIISLTNLKQHVSAFKGHFQALYKEVYIYRVSQEECARLREGVPYAKVYRYNPKHLYPKLNGYGDNGQ